jgi:predicted DNA-binding transcriptional regulator AlpA
MTESPLIAEVEILEKTGWAKSTLDNKISSGQFPKKVTRSNKLGRLFWRNSVYNSWNPNDSEKDPFYDAIHG